MVHRVIAEPVDLVSELEHRPQKMGSDFAIGAVATCIADTCLFPLDTIRTRQMVRMPRVSMLREAQSLVRAEGVRALYKGLPVHLLASAPGSGIFYAAYEAAKQALTPHLSSEAAVGAIAGAAACLASLVVFNPMEVVKQRVMVQRDVGSAQVLAAVLREGGPAELWRGIGAGALTWAPYFSLYFLAYEELTKHAVALLSRPDPPFLVSLGCGLAAGAGSAALTTPFDVVKTQLQVGATGLGARRAGAAASRSAFAVARDIAAAEGAAGFCRGMLPRVLMLAPASSLTIACYSTMQAALKRREEAAAEEAKRRKGKK